MASILIVDDDTDNTALIALMLKRGGHVAYTASSGGEALELADRHRPDLILLDATLPDISGYEACRRLRARPTTSATPILFLSAHTDARSARQAMESGGTRYLTKPITPQELLHEVKEALR